MHRQPIHDDRMISRRRLLLAASALAAAPLASAQSSDRVRRVHMLHVGNRTAPQLGLQKALIEGMQARGWSEGRNLQLEDHYGEGRPENLTLLAAKIMRAAPDVIVAFGPAPAVELKKAGTSTPVVFIAVFDPIKLGLSQSLARPDGVFTGLSTAPDTFFSKQVELLRNVVPQLSRVAMLTNPNNPIHTAFRERRVKQAIDLGLETIEVHATAPEELEPAFREAAARGAQAVMVGGDPMPMSNRSLVADLALRHRLPTIFLFKEHVEDGGLISYGTDLVDLHRRGAEYVDRLLRGAKPGDLPIAQPERFDLVINLKTAKTLGLKVPQVLLVRATRVIE